MNERLRPKAKKIKQYRIIDESSAFPGLETLH